MIAATCPAHHAFNAIFEWYRSPFRINMRVLKTGVGYSGPGVVTGCAVTEDGSLLVIVSHRIQGGAGFLKHIYAQSMLTPLPWGTANVEPQEQAGADDRDPID